MPRFYGQNDDLRLSYEIWQEGVTPTVVVELISPGTEREDYGQTLRDAAQPPTKGTHTNGCCASLTTSFSTATPMTCRGFKTWRAAIKRCPLRRGEGGYPICSLAWAFDKAPTRAAIASGLDPEE